MTALINNIRDLSPIDFAFSASTKITYKNKVYEANIYPNSRIELIDKNNTDSLNFICTSDSCASYFLWPFTYKRLSPHKSICCGNWKYFTLYLLLPQIN